MAWMIEAKRRVAVTKRGKKVSKQRKQISGRAKNSNRKERDAPASDKKPRGRGLGVILGDTPESLVPKPE